MAKQLLEYITDDKELNDSCIVKEFEEKYDTQNGGILDEDILTWVKKLQPNMGVKYLVLKSTIQAINTNNSAWYLVSIDHKHTYAQYVHDNIVETYDTKLFQHTTNNCSLYAGLVLILRPLVKSMDEMFNILKMVEDTYQSDSCAKLAYISEHYFNRGIEWFNFINIPKIIHVKQSTANTLYLFFHGLSPFGLLYSYTTTQQMRILKGNDFRLYQRSQNTPMKELPNFIRFINIVKHHYTKIVFIGHSYGSTFANYFAQYMVDNDKTTNITKVISVSLDGSELIDTCEYIAYDVLGLSRDLNIEYKKNRAICDGHDLVREWYEQEIIPSAKERFEVDLCENNYLDWYRTAKQIEDMKLNHRHIVFQYMPNKKEPFNKLRIEKLKEDTYCVRYLSKYCHTLHMYRDIAVELLKMIDEAMK